MGRKGLGPAAGGPEDQSQRERHRPHCRGARGHGGRTTLSREASGFEHDLTVRRRLRRFVLLPVVLFGLAGVPGAAAPAEMAAQTVAVSSARLWPAVDYTRVTIESPA